MQKKATVVIGMLASFSLTSAHAQDTPGASSYADMPASTQPNIPFGIGKLPPKPGWQLQGATEIKFAKDAGDMAFPQAKLRGIHITTEAEFIAKHPDRSKVPSGLYLLDTDIIPKNLPEILSKNGVALGPDGGIVDNQGKKAVLVLRHKLVAVSKKRSGLEQNHLKYGLLKRSLFDLFSSSSADAAYPFGLEWVSAWASYHSYEGFCRTARESTGADAWGPVIDQWGDRVHTNIQYIQAYANATDATSNQWCVNCSSQFATAEQDYGCGWPAHDGSRFSFAYLKDYNFSWYWSWY
jgi:hypothetical protein